MPERQNIHPVIKKYTAALLMVSIFVGLIFPCQPMDSTYFRVLKSVPEIHGIAFPASEISYELLKPLKGRQLIPRVLRLDSLPAEWNVALDRIVQLAGVAVPTKHGICNCAWT